MRWGRYPPVVRQAYADETPEVRDRRAVAPACRAL